MKNEAALITCFFYIVIGTQMPWKLKESASLPEFSFLFCCYVSSLDDDTAVPCRRVLEAVVLAVNTSVLEKFHQGPFVGNCLVQNCFWAQDLSWAIVLIRRETSYKLLVLQGISNIMNKALACYRKWKPIKINEYMEQLLFSGTKVIFHKWLYIWLLQLVQCCFG